MGYFSTFSINQFEKEFNSFDAEEQLRIRIKELNDRLAELWDVAFAHKNPLILMDVDLQYSLPEDLCSIRHIQKAIELTETRLTSYAGMMAEEEERSGKDSIFMHVEKKKHIAA